MYNKIESGSQPTPETGSITSENAKNTVVYEKCIGCPDVGAICNGPNMLTLPIEGVREMVKRRKNTLKITNEKLSEQSGIPLTTINRFLSPSVTTDFKYTTVSDIVKAVIGYGQEGNYSFHENPCPATTSEIRQQIEENTSQLHAAQSECQRLREELEQSNQKRRDQRAEIRQEDQKKIDHLKNQVEYLEERCEYLKQTAEKRYKLILVRDWIIIILAILLVCLLALTIAYLVWDYLHPGFGIFW